MKHNTQSQAARRTHTCLTHTRTHTHTHGHEKVGLRNARTHTHTHTHARTNPSGACRPLRPMTLHLGWWLVASSDIYIYIYIYIYICSYKYIRDPLPFQLFLVQLFHAWFLYGLETCMNRRISASMQICTCFSSCSSNVAFQHANCHLGLSQSSTFLL